MNSYGIDWNRPDMSWAEWFTPGYNMAKFTKNIFQSIGQGASKLWNGLSGENTAKAISEANERNIEMQNYWNEIQMNREDTAHQREVADLQAAGLNPWLSASGSGAPAGALNSAQVEPVDGSKILQATSAMAVLALTKLLLKK